MVTLNTPRVHLFIEFSYCLNSKFMWARLRVADMFKLLFVNDRLLDCQILQPFIKALDAKSMLTY